MFNLNDEHDLDNRWQHAGLIRIKREQAKGGRRFLWLTVMCNRSLASFDVRAINHWGQSKTISILFGS